SITAHCASESQNRSAIVASKLPTAAQNHKTRTPATPWFGSHPSVGQRQGQDFCLLGFWEMLLLQLSIGSGPKPDAAYGHQHGVVVSPHNPAAFDVVDRL
ncbi:hypothetical protein, partial [Methylobacterium aerolatum]